MSKLARYSVVWLLNLGLLALQKIRRSMRIFPGDKNRVFTVLANERLRSAVDTEARLGLKPGRSRAYVDFDANHREVELPTNTRTREPVAERAFKGEVDLKGSQSQFL